MVVNPVLRVRDRAFGPQARLVMAIVNRTPDSFYDGGATYALEAACARVDEVVAQGADIVDIGGVKAGVGPEVTAGQEIERVVDVVTYARRAHPEVLVSVDTWRAQVADAVCAAGADIINDPWGGPDPLLPEVAARHGATLVVAHAGGMAPREDPHGVAFDDVVADVLAVTDGLAARAEAAGVGQARIVRDPAHEFGKTTAHSLEITRRIAELVATGRPVLVAMSRKDFVGETLDLPTDQRLAGTLAATALCAAQGVMIYRAHDVAATRQVLDMVSTITGDRPPVKALRGLT